jgi:LCP family protein required for cell wall assembly
MVITKANFSMETTPSLEPITEVKNTNRFWIKYKRRLLKHVWLIRAALVAALATGVYLLVLLLCFLNNRLGIGTFLHFAGDFIRTPENQIESQAGRTNLLILGKAGLGHDSPDLTDSLIFASVSLSSPSATLISIPRDTWIPEIRAKINSAYYWGKQKEEGGGLTLSKSLTEEITGQPVNYGLVVDFSGFTEIVDIVGGIKVEVENSFIDRFYPIPGKEDDLCGGDKELSCRYETISFTKGIQTMDGATALKYVRSRRAEGDEGTDLARANRQQKVLMAIRTKMLRPSTYLNPVKLWKIWQVVKSAVETDLTPSATAILLRKVFNARDTLSSVVINPDLLTSPPITERYDKQYVFIPKAGSWTEIHTWVECTIDSNCSTGK